MQCPYCKCPEVETTGDPDEDGQVEYHCLECGEYFVDAAEPGAAAGEPWPLGRKAGKHGSTKD